MQLTGDKLNKLKLSHEISFGKWMNMIFENAVCCDDEENYLLYVCACLYVCVLFVSIFKLNLDVKKWSVS